MAIRRLDSLGYQLGLLNRLYDRRLQEALAPLGVAPGQFPALMMLFQKDGLTQAELCRRIGVEQPTMANTLARMERDGLIRRETDAGDKRRSFIFLTAKIKERQDAIVNQARTVAGFAVTGLSAAEQDTLFALLGRLADKLKPDGD
ncbi:MAG: MarR family transcriptional regulator [Rhodospirillaceae bacterium]|nr:MarR family transcriptional regulator [Rhodospirillaceae bacterium]